MRVCNLIGPYFLCSTLSVPVSEWTGIVLKEFEDFLHSELAEDDYDKPEAREKALEGQINWFWEHHDALIEETIAKGKGSLVATKILRPIVQMVSASLCRL
jgi:hypothetical protein